MNLPIADAVKTSEKPKAATVTRSLESPDNSVPLCSTEDRKFHDQLIQIDHYDIRVNYLLRYDNETENASRSTCLVITKASQGGSTVSFSRNTFLGKFITFLMKINSMLNYFRAIWKFPQYLASEKNKPPCIL